MKTIIVISYILLLSIKATIAQPYVYLEGKLVDSTALNPNYWFYNIDRVNLSTEIKELYLYEGYFHNLLTWDPSQTWLIVDYYGYEVSKIYHCNDTLVAFDLPESIAGLNETFLFSEAENYIYILGYNGISETINAFNLSSGQIDNSDILHRGDHNYYEGMFFSSEKDKIYLAGYDTISNSDQLIVYSANSKEITETKNLALYGYPNADYYFLYAGRNGKGIVESFFMNDTISYYRIYDFDLNTGSNFIERKGFAIPFFTENGNSIILAETDIDEQSVISTGNLFFYSLETTELARTLSLTSGGNVYAFENFPNTLYYVNDLETSPQIFEIDVDSILENQDTRLKH